MRTTVDLPTPLFRRAKARAAARGETLRTLLTRAIEAEVGAADTATAPRDRRVKLPLFGDPRGPKVNLTNAAIERILAEDEARHYGLLRPERRKKR